MHRRSFLYRVAWLGAFASPWTIGATEVYPARSIRLVVPVGPGGGTDTMARLIGDELRAKWGHPVIVENRAGGAGGLVGAEYVARSEPDGYTLLIAGPGPLVTDKLLYPKLGFEPSEFVPISLISANPNVLLARAGSPFRSVSELIAFAKANPGKLNYASGGAGTTGHLAMEQLKVQAGIDIQHVPYKGAAAATTGLLGSQVDVMFGEITTVMSHIKAGTLRALAVGTETRAPSLPEVPTMAETLPGFVTTVWFALVAPPKTPPEIANKLSAAMVDILKQANVVAKLKSMNVQPVGSTAGEMSKFVQQEAERWGKIIRTAKIAIE